PHRHDCRRLRRRSRGHGRQSARRHHRRPPRALRDESRKGVPAMMRTLVPGGLFVTIVLGLSALAPRASQLAPPFDLLIRNGRLVDGTGSPWYAADIGIRDGRIAAIGRLADKTARQTIDAANHVVAPGFIDMLGQSELTVLDEPTLPSKIFQGITTEITGEGGSAAPLNDAIVKADKVDYEHLKVLPDWRTFAQYFT